MLKNALFTCGVAAILSGCGGLVVFDDGANSGGAGPVGPGPVGPGAGPATTCQTFCAATASCPDQGGDCQQSCAALYMDGCTAETDAFLNCIAANLGLGCQLSPDDCVAEIAAWTQCSQVPEPAAECQTDGCSNGMNDCSCEGSCTSGNQISSATVTCKQGFDAPPQCECFLDGAFMGSCTDFDKSSCSLESSCCVEVFFGFQGGDDDGF